MNYDFGARHYDPRIGRWTGVDLLAETYENVSPYNYVANSPINNIDANGMDFSQGIPCPKWGEPSGGLFSAGANVLASFAAGLLGSVGNGPVALDKANAPGQQASFQSRSNITSSLNEDGTTVQEGGGDPGGKKKANVKARKGGGEAFSLAKMYGHFQIGENQPLNIDASSLDFSGMSQKQLGLTNLAVDYSKSINLFRSGINSVSLAFGKVFITNRGNNQFQINQDVFDFNIEWQNGFSARNAGTLLGAFINYNLLIFPELPLIMGGPYQDNFIGTVTIPK